MWYKDNLDVNYIADTYKRVPDYNSVDNHWYSSKTIPSTDELLSVRYITDSGKNRTTTCRYYDNAFRVLSGKSLNVNEWSITVFKKVKGRY